MRCPSCGCDVERFRELLEKYNRLYRFVFDIAERFAETKNTKEAVGRMLEEWLEEQLK